MRATLRPSSSVRAASPSENARAASPSGNHRAMASRPVIGTHVAGEFLNARLHQSMYGSSQQPTMHGSGFVPVAGDRRRNLSRRTPPTAGFALARGSSISQHFIGDPSWQTQTPYESSNDRAGYGPRSHQPPPPQRPHSARGNTPQRPLSARGHTPNAGAPVGYHAGQRPRSAGGDTARAGAIGPAYAAWLARHGVPADYATSALRTRAVEPHKPPPPPPPLWWYDQPIGPREKVVPRSYVRSAASGEDALLADVQKLADKHLGSTLRPWPDHAGKLIC